MYFQLLPQPLILHQQQLHLVGLLQASRGQGVECTIAWDFCWLTRLDIPVRETVLFKNNILITNLNSWHFQIIQNVLGQLARVKTVRQYHSIPVD